jgi:hypothetical protein
MKRSGIRAVARKSTAQRKDAEGAESAKKMQVKARPACGSELPLANGVATNREQELTSPSEAQQAESGGIERGAQTRAAQSPDSASLHPGYHELVDNNEKEGWE